MAGPLLPSGKILLPDTTRKPATASTATDWVRPSDWLPMPRVEAYEQKICILHAVFNHDSNFAAFTIAGNYTVDWGDGTVDNVNSGVTALHNYSYSNATLTGTECSRGYKQAMITITPQAGANLTSVNFQVKHTTSGLQDGYGTGFLDFVFSAQNCTSFTLGGSTIKHVNLERFISLSSGPLSSAGSLFRFCYKIKQIDLRGLNLGSAQNFSYMLNSCCSIWTIDLSTISTASATNFSNFASSCYSLLKLDVSNFVTNNVLYMDSFIANCISLEKIILGNIVTASVQNFSSFANNCGSLTSLDMSAQSFNSCTNASNIVASCTSLSKALIPCKIDFSVANCRLSATALNALYAQLPTGLTGKTLTVTGNYGTSGDDPSQAPSGWTISG